MTDGQAWQHGTRTEATGWLLLGGLLGFSAFVITRIIGIVMMDELASWRERRDVVRRRTGDY